MRRDARQEHFGPFEERRIIAVAAFVREGLRYVARRPELGVPLLMMALIGCFVYEFQVVLPVLAKHDLHGSAEIPFGRLEAKAPASG